MNMLFGMFDDIKKNNFGKVEIRIYFRKISIIEFYNDRFEKSLKKIDNLISRFNKKINRYNITGDIDKVLMVYSYIFNNILCDCEYNRLSKKQKEMGFESLNYLERRKLRKTQTLEGIITKKTVCTGYSYIFKVLLNRLGIKSIINIGYYIDKEKEIPHRWNTIKIDNNWYNIDITIGLIEYKKIIKGKIPKYFLLSDKKFEKRYIRLLEDRNNFSTKLITKYAEKDYKRELIRKSFKRLKDDYNIILK